MQDLKRVVIRAARANMPALLVLVALFSTPVQAQALRTNAGFNANSLARNDDGSTGAVVLPFTANFFGTTETSLFVNNNGNVTFDAPLSIFTPFNLISTSQQIIAPFFADVDTRNTGSDIVRYGTDTVNGHTAFGVNWDGVGVGYYNQHFDKLNSFQLVLIDRSDTGAGNFDIEFNYKQIQWESGDVSGGVNGLGGSSARAGYSNGTTASFELAGSGVAGSFLDSNPNGLVNSSNVGFDGRFVFEARNGTVVPAAVPLPTTAFAGIALLLGLGSMKYIRARKSIVA